MVVPLLRLPLQLPADYRDSSVLKDAIIENGYIEVFPDNINYTFKRAGTTQKVVGGGVASGIFVYGTKIYSWDAGNTATTPTATLLSSL